MWFGAFLFFVIACSIIRAHTYQDAFEMVCIPNQACYYVSKYKTNWRNAQQMCQQKIQQYSTSFNETDNVLLNPLTNELLTKRYWVLEPTNDNGHQKPREMTIILNRKKRSFMISYPDSIMESVYEVRNWDWPHLIDLTMDTDREELRNNIETIFEMIHEGRQRQLSRKLISQWQRTFNILRQTRVNRQFERLFGRWTELTDEFGSDNLGVFIDEFNPHLQHFWRIKLKTIMMLLKRRQYQRLNRRLLDNFKTFLYKLNLKIRGKNKLHQRIIKEWEVHVKWLVKYKWEQLMKFISIRYQKRVRLAIRRLLDIIRRKRYEIITPKIITDIRFATKLLKRVYTINVEYGGPERYELITRITRLINIDWENKINEIDGIDKTKWIEKFKWIIPLIKSKKYPEIDTKILKEFKEIIVKIKPSVPANRIGNIRIKLVTNYVDLLKKWNWEELVKKVDEKEREKVTQEITNVIKLVAEKRFKEIDENVFNRIRTVFKVVRELQPRKLLKPDVVLKRVNRYINILTIWNWPELIKKIDEKDQDRVTQEIKTIIQLVKDKRENEIDMKLLDRVKVIYKLLEKVKPKTTDLTIDTSIKSVNYLIKINWPKLVEYIEETKRPEIINKIKTFISLVETKQFDKIDANLMKYITETIIKLTKIKNIPTNNKLETQLNITVVTDKSNKYVTLLNELKWEELVKYIDEKNRPDVVNKIKIFLERVQNKEFDKIDSYTINLMTKIINSLETIRKINEQNLTKEKNIKIITDNSNKNLKILTELKWEELTKFIDEDKKDESIKKIKTFISLTENKEFDKIDQPLIDWIVNIVEKFKKTREIPDGKKLEEEKEKKVIIENSENYVKILTELKWEELTKYIEESNRPETTTKINTFITLVKNKELDKIDTFTFNWITQIISTLTEIKKTNDKNKIIEEQNRKTIIETSTKSLEYLKELKWEELVKYIDENKREEIIKKINLFIKLVQKQEFDKIDINFLNYITDTITSIKTIKIVPEIKKVPDVKNETLVEETTTKFTKFLEELKWETLTKFIDEKNRPEMENKIKTFITLVQNKEFNKIDTDYINKITDIITTLRKTKEININNEIAEEKIKKTITDTSIKSINLLTELKWETLVKYIDDKSREDIADKIKTFISYVENKQFENINTKLIEWINHIIVTLKNIRKINIENPVTEKNNTEIITALSKKNFELLKEINWEELVTHVDDKSRPIVVEKIKKFLVLIENKQLDKIDIDLTNWITEIITTLRKIKAINEINKENEAKRIKMTTDLSVKYIELLNELKWPDLVKFIDESNRPEVINKIKTFITFVENKQFDKIDNYLFSWIKEIIVTLRKVNEINIINKVTDENNKQIIKTTSKNYFNILIELKWEELMKYVEQSQRPEIISKVKEFLTNVEQGQFDKITVELLNWLVDIITTLRRIKVTKYTSEKQEIVNKIQITLPSNWMEIVRRIKGIDHNLWIGRIQYLLTMSDSKEYKKVDFDWIEELQKIIQLISQEYIQYKKEMFLNEESITKIRESVRLLQEWKWETYLKYIDEKNRQQIQADITEMISVSLSGNFEKLDAQFVKWFQKIFEIFTQINDAIKNGYEYDSTTKTWVKHVVSIQSARKKRSTDDSSIRSAHINVEMLSDAMSNLQQALYYNQMLLDNDNRIMHRTDTQNDYRYQLCPFIDKAKGKLTTQMTNCDLNQRFICKRMLM